MINQITKVAKIICSLVLVFLSFSTIAADVLGKKPRHVWGGPSSIINDHAIGANTPASLIYRKTIWWSDKEVG